MKTSEYTRRDPQKGKKEFSTSKGFTIIELMVVIAVIAIVTSFALPSYRTLIEKRQVTSGAQQFAAFLSSAKMESVKRNEMIAIWRDASNECMGFYVYELDNPRTNCDCTKILPGDTNACTIDEFGDGVMKLHVLNNSLLNKPVNVTAINLGGGDNLVIFDPVRGMLVADDTVSLPMEAKLLSKHQTYGLNVRLLATGRVTVCSDTSQADIVVPGFDKC